MFCAKIVLMFVVLNQVFSSAIPIWELLTHQEKIGNLTFVFLQLVHQYCKHSQIPDCEKVLTLYGVSNLVRESEQSLDLLDPFHSDSRGALWRTAMNGAFDLPPAQKGGKTQEEEQGRRENQVELERDLNTISNTDLDRQFVRSYDDYNLDAERYPHAIRVAPPPHFKYPPASKVITKRNLNRGKSLSNTPSASPTHIQAGTEKRAKTQDSPIISIIPYVRSSASEGAKSAKKAGPRRVTSSSSSNSQQPRRNDDPNTFYILPSNRRNEPILLKILQN